MNPLYQAYLEGDAELRGVFSRMPEALFTDPPPAGAWADGVAAALNNTQQTLGSASADVTGNEPVIATGQQTGLFTGPLYTIYKAVTAVKLARRFQAAGTPCVPVFWVAGDDHDFEEARSAHFLTKRHQLLTLTYAPTGKDVMNMPMYRVPLDKQLHGFIDTAADACRSAECAGEVRALLHDTLEMSDSMADWFARIMAWLFADTGLCIFLPWDSAARHAVVPVLEREIRHPLASTQLLIEQGRMLESLGYAPAIQRARDACNFFVERGGRRRTVFFRDGRYVVAATKETWTPDAMLALLAESPELFSANVALRPVIQQQLFPVVAYVAGPGEVAYWAQLKPLFAFFEKPMPAVYPRMQCVLTTLKTNRLLRQYGLDSAAIINNDDALARALRADGPNPALAAFASHRPGVLDSLHQLTGAVKDCRGLPDAADAAARFERNALAGLDKLERRLLYADTAKRQTVEARIERLRTVFAPLNRPQERALSVFSFLFEHGRPLIERMTDELALDTAALQEIEL